MVDQGDPSDPNHEMSGMSGMSEMSAEELGEAMRNSSELSASLSPERAKRFYDRMRESVRRYLDKKGKMAGTAGEYLMLAPDIFVLLWRLVNDARVDGKSKVLLGSGLAYYLFPLDIIPEAILGAPGYVDDLVIGVLILKTVLGKIDPQVLREHWSGSEDLLTAIQNVLNAADGLVGSDVVKRFKKMK
jgi:uncharacterized membrane protein YkvA (DUF1232 family)